MVCVCLHVCVCAHVCVCMCVVLYIFKSWLEILMVLYIFKSWLEILTTLLCVCCSQYYDKEKTFKAELEILTTLLCVCCSQYHDKEKTFKAQLKSLTTLLPTLHVHLVMSLAFSSSTNKFEFLDLAYVSPSTVQSSLSFESSLSLNWCIYIYTRFPGSLWVLASTYKLNLQSKAL